jgi:protein O-GlcNAc transferase
MISTVMAKHFTLAPLQRAQSALAAGDAAAAASLCRGLLLRSPTTTEARYFLGLALAMQADTAGAVAQWRQLLRTSPMHFPALANLGVALSQLSLHAEAVASLRAALALDDSDSHVHYSLGNALLASGDCTAAASNFRGALDRDPRFVDAWNNLGVCLRRGDQLPEAIEAFRQALALDPNHFSARDNLGDVLYALGVTRHRSGQLAMAVEAYEQAIALHPDRSIPRRDRARALESLQRLGAALQGYRDAVALAPEPDCLAGVLSCATRTCDWQIGSQSLRQLRGLPQGLLSLHPFLSLSVCDEPSEQREIAVARAGVLAAEAKLSGPAELAAATDRAVRPEQRLRIAYVSSDLRDHAVAHLLAGVLEHHDRGRFEIHAVSLQRADLDSAIGRRLARAVDHFHDVSKLPDLEAAQLLREAAIDIALDLNGHTVGGRPGIFARRAAPVQVNYLGYAGTSGAPWMDWIVADRVVIPPGTEYGYCEQVLRLPHCYLPNDDRREIATAPSRAQVGLPEAGFVFCAFTNAYKINAPLFAVWMRLLRQIPASVLWLRSMGPEATRNLQREAQARDVDPQRLLFAPHLPHMAEHLARLSLADLYLDTLPYNAHSTSCDALWAGVPVLTCIGRSFAGRVAASVLTAAGLPELITADCAAYEELALALARDPARLATVRGELRAARRSALFDTAAYTRNLENLFERMHCVASQQSRG